MFSRIHPQPKDPDAVLDYAFNWASEWLAEGETVVSSEVTATGVTINSHSQADGIVVATVSGGSAGTTASIRYRVTTSAGRTDDRTLLLRIRER